MSSRSQSEFPPWMTQKRAKADAPKKDDPLLHHQEIMNFVRYIKLNSTEKAQRAAVVESLSKVITGIYPIARVEVYGSFETDLCLPQSDIDVVVFGTGMDSEEPNAAALFHVSQAIMDSGMAKTPPTVISSARVPIIKFQEETTGIMVDVSFECGSALATTEVIKNYCKRYPMLRPLTIVVKYYLKQRYLNETWSGGIGSYTLVVMVLSFLQMQTATGGRTRRTEEGEDLSTLLLQFLQFYGSQFDYFHNVISVINGGTYLRKEDKSWTSNAAPDALSIEDPTNPELDLAAASFRIQDARAVFMEGFWRLTHESPRWANTHSFLARLFDHGPLPEGVDVTALPSSSTSISPRGMQSASDGPTRASPNGKSANHDGNANGHSQSPASPNGSRRAGSSTSASHGHHTDSKDLRSSSELVNGHNNNGHASTQNHGNARGYQPTSTPSTDATNDLSPNGKQQAQQKTPTKKQQHRRPQHSPNGPKPQQHNDQRHHQQGHQATTPGAAKGGAKKTPNHSPRKNGASVSPRKKADDNAHTLDPEAPEYHPLFPALPPKASTTNGSADRPPSSARNGIAADEKTSLANAS